MPPPSKGYHFEFSYFPFGRVELESVDLLRRVECWLWGSWLESRACRECHRPLLAAIKGIPNATQDQEQPVEHVNKYCFDQNQWSFVKISLHVGGSSCEAGMRHSDLAIAVQATWVVRGAQQKAIWSEQRREWPLPEKVATKMAANWLWQKLSIYREKYNCRLICELWEKSWIWV